jgi:hypothetical protein
VLTVNANHFIVITVGMNAVRNVSPVDQRIQAMIRISAIVMSTDFYLIVRFYN